MLNREGLEFPIRDVRFSGPEMHLGDELRRNVERLCVEKDPWMPRGRWTGGADQSRSRET